MRVLIFLILWSVSSKALVFAQFHPYDDTFLTISHYLKKAHSSVDIAMYNMDLYEGNKVASALRSDEVQSRIQNHTLKVRIIFEGDARSSRYQERLRTFAALGVEVRGLKSGKKMHHKFAIIDGKSSNPVLISGSANWSLVSRYNYNENILFFEGEESITQDFMKQYEWLWSLSESPQTPDPSNLKSELPKSFSLQEKERTDGITGMEVFFNSENFKVSDEDSLVTDDSKEGFFLTRQVVKAIDQAQMSLQIATTRIKLRPVYEALLRAAKRGVKVQILVSMDEYETFRYRQKKSEPQCEEAYNKTCSSGHNFSVFLERENFPGSENLDVRIKFFDMNMRGHLSKQMHSKYMIVDHKKLLTGSFNWSYSAEYGHIENLIKIEGLPRSRALIEFQNDFLRIYDMNRQDYEKTKEHFRNALKEKQKIPCHFEPLSLTFSEIDQLYALDDDSAQTFKDICL